MLWPMMMMIQFSCTSMPFKRSWTFSFVLIISIFLIVEMWVNPVCSFEIYGRFERNLFIIITRDNPMDIRIHEHWWQYLPMPATWTKCAWYKEKLPHFSSIINYVESLWSIRNSNSKLMSAKNIKYHFGASRMRVKF